VVVDGKPKQSLSIAQSKLSVANDALYVCLLRINQKRLILKLSWPVSRASSRAMTQTTDLVLQVKERQQGGFVFCRCESIQPNFGGSSSLAEKLGRYGVNAARMPIGSTRIGLPAKFLKIWIQ
jgi:hypothetical protein